MLQRIRDEAHRFANGYHQFLMKRRIAESLLDDCPASPRRGKKSSSTNSAASPPPPRQPRRHRRDRRHQPQTRRADRHLSRPARLSASATINKHAAEDIGRGSSIAANERLDSTGKFQKLTPSFLCSADGMGRGDGRPDLSGRRTWQSHFRHRDRQADHTQAGRTR